MQACQGSGPVLGFCTVARDTHAKECPLCGGTMRLKHTEHIVHISGNPQGTKHTTDEWTCPDCDHFEEAEGE